MQQSILVPEATIWANWEELSYEILYTKFQASEASGSETGDFFHIAYVILFPTHFYDSNLGLSRAGPFCTSGPSLEQIR